MERKRLTQNGIITENQENFQLFTASIIKTSYSYHVTIPIEIVRHLKLKREQKIEVAIRLSKLPNQPKKIKFTSSKPNISSREYINAFMKSKHESILLEGIKRNTIANFLYKHPEYPIKLRVKNYRKETEKLWLIKIRKKE